MLSVKFFIVMLNAILLSVIILNEVMLGVVFFTVTLRRLPAKYHMLSVVLLSVMESFVEFFFGLSGFWTEAQNKESQK